MELADLVHKDLATRFQYKPFISKLAPFLIPPRQTNLLIIVFCQKCSGIPRPSCEDQSMRTGMNHLSVIVITLIFSGSIFIIKRSGTSPLRHGLLPSWTGRQARAPPMDGLGVAPSG